MQFSLQYFLRVQKSVCRTREHSFEYLYASGLGVAYFVPHEHSEVAMLLGEI